MTFRFVICPVLSSVPIGELFLSSVSWSDPVFGTGASFTGKAEIGPDQTKETLLALTQPDAVALYVKDDDTGQYLFGGPIYDNPWGRSERRLTVVAQSWKAWTYQKMLQMNTTVNPVTDVSYSQTNKDQFLISRLLIAATVNADVGCPTVNLGSELSGVIRTITGTGSEMKFLGNVIDSMANRDNGFEWEIQVRPDNTGNPVLWFAPSFPARGGLNNRLLLLHQMAEGGNILEMGDPENSAADRRSRIWATGTGQPPDQPVAFDQDPSVATDFALLRESVTNYNTVSGIATLADHARAERIYRNQTLQQVHVTVALDNPDFRTYASGDKVKLVVSDDWIDWDFDAVRIINRTFNINNEGEQKIDKIDLLIDLNDTDLPENITVV